MQPARAPRPTFRCDRLLRIAAIERWHFWFVARRALLRREIARRLPSTRHALGGPIVDLGCGTGSMVRDLQHDGQWAVGVEARPECLNARSRMVRGSVGALPLRDGVAPAVLLLDVLEHTDDLEALREARRILQPAGIAFITVPALPALWSRRDEDAGHRRRYTRATLADVLQRSGFRVMDLRYHQFALLPLVAATRVLARRRPRWRDREDFPPSLVNAVLSRVSLAEVALSRWLRWPLGSTLLAVAERAA